MISKTHISAQKPRGRQLNVKVCGYKSAIFRLLSFFLSSLQPLCSNNDNSKTVQVLTVILSQNWCLSQRGAIRPLSVFIATNSPRSIKLFTALPGCCPLRRTPFSNIVRMRTRSLVPKPKTTIICLGARLVHTWNRGDFRIWTRFLRRYVYFRVISIHFNPYSGYCMHAHCMITTDLLHTHMETIVATSRRLVERWTIGHMSYSLLDLRDCSAVLQCLFNAGSPLLLITINVFSSHPQHKFVVLTTVLY